MTAALRRIYGDTMVDALEARISAGSSPEIDPAYFALSLSGDVEAETVTTFLQAAANVGLLQSHDVYRCPNTNCKQVLDDDVVDQRHCPHCHIEFADFGPMQSAVIFRIPRGVSRDIPWLIVVHGFNTLGSWQEDFSWRIANKIKYSAPVLVYKYGLVRIGVLFKWRHRQLARQLGARIRAAMHFANENGISEPPDLVLHSFGTHLFTTLLGSNEFNDLQFGRVITVGSVVRPDFCWSDHIAQKRIEALLNHCGGADWAVPFAQYLIPGTGPGGRIGFMDHQVINTVDRNYGHSSAFDSAELAGNLATNGLWDRFFRQPIDSLGVLKSLPNSSVVWRPASFILREFARDIAVFMIFGVAALLLFLQLVGFNCIF